jgi:hypothetical protein
MESLRSEEGVEVLMDRAVSRMPLDGRDRGLAVEIAYGVLRRMRTIDWRLALVVDKPLSRLPAAVQMLYPCVRRGIGIGQTCKGADPEAQAGLEWIRERRLARTDPRTSPTLAFA